MSNPWRAQVNQKLYFVQLLLTDAQAKTGPAQQALLQGAVFHLATAYRLYLKEIVQHQNHSTDALDARNARRQFAAQEWHCQELEELAQLEETNSWPARLLSEYRDVIGDGATAISTKFRTDAIVVADITEGADIDTYEQWLEQFRQLIEMHRSVAQEW